MGGHGVSTRLDVATRSGVLRSNPGICCGWVHLHVTIPDASAASDFPHAGLNDILTQEARHLFRNNTFGLLRTLPQRQLRKLGRFGDRERRFFCDGWPMRACFVSMQDPNTRDVLPCRALREPPAGRILATQAFPDPAGSAVLKCVQAAIPGGRVVFSTVRAKTCSLGGFEQAVRVPSAGLSGRWRGGNWENLGDLGTVSGGFSAACTNTKQLSQAACAIDAD
jgi:hypothetical protein